MSKNVQLIFNSYKQRLRILIDGMATSVYGNLQQYMDEPFIFWCDKILDGISDETNGEEFTLTYIGSKEENSIMQVLAKSCNTCIKYTYHEPIRSTGTIERMQKLHRLIKNKNLSGYQRQNKHVTFIVSEELMSIKAELANLDIKNVFCEIVVSVMSVKDFINRSSNGNECVFAILSADKFNSLIEKLNLNKAFIILVSDDPLKKVTFVRKLDEVFQWQAGTQNVFDAIFEGLLLSPLLKAFRECVNSFPENIKQMYSEHFEDILSITEKIIPLIENKTVEVGKSNRLQFKSDIDNRIISGTKFRYSYEPEGIIHCDGFAIEGLSEGKARLNVHREGEAIPCVSLNLTVVKRNRIKKIILEKNVITVGEGQDFRINFSYEPRDADNANLIEWHSDNPKVAVVNKRGVVFPKEEGACTISCFAEKICAKCHVTVKPMLQSIVPEEDYIVLQYGEVHELKIHCIPATALDAQLRITSMDMRIVNIVDGKLQGTGEGTVRIIISNSFDTIRKEITVTVQPPQKKHWWSWIFKE